MWRPREVVLPSVTRLDQLFSLITPHERLRPLGAPWPSSDLREGTSYIGPYCSVDGRNVLHRSLYVRARPEVLQVIKAHTINCGARDEMYFKIVMRENDALVTCDHGVILGGVWLAKVSLDEVRKYVGTEE